VIPTHHPPQAPSAHSPQPTSAIPNLRHQSRASSHHDRATSAATAPHPPCHCPTPTPQHCCARGPAPSRCRRHMARPGRALSNFSTIFFPRHPPPRPLRKSNTGPGQTERPPAWQIPAPCGLEACAATSLVDYSSPKSLARKWPREPPTCAPPSKSPALRSAAPLLEHPIGATPASTPPAKPPPRPHLAAPPRFALAPSHYSGQETRVSTAAAELGPDHPGQNFLPSQAPTARFR